MKNCKLFFFSCTRLYTCTLLACQNHSQSELQNAHLCMQSVSLVWKGNLIYFKLSHLFLYMDALIELNFMRLDALINMRPWKFLINIDLMLVISYNIISRASTWISLDIFVFVFPIRRCVKFWLKCRHSFLREIWILKILNEWIIEMIWYTDSHKSYLLETLFIQNNCTFSKNNGEKNVGKYAKERNRKWKWLFMMQ